jgi:hypothetical protein
MIEGQEGVTWDEWLALADACEDAGLEGLFRSDHYTSVFGALDRGSLDAWTTPAGIAAHTERIRLGTMVSPATFRHPSALARAAATVDHISGGRVELGLGAGWYELEHRAHGFEFPEHGERVEIFAEQLEIIHRQWTEEAFDFTGRHYRLEDCRALPKPVQRPRPPLIVGGTARSGTLEPAVRSPTSRRPTPGSRAPSRRSWSSCWRSRRPGSRASCSSTSARRPRRGRAARIAGAAASRRRGRWGYVKVPARLKKRRGFSIIIVSICSCVTPASRSAGRTTFEMRR